MKKAPDKSQVWDILQNTWSVPLRTVKVIRSKESLRNSDSHEEFLNRMYLLKQAGKIILEKLR